MTTTLGFDHPDGEIRSYIVTLKENVDKTAHFNQLQPHFSSQCEITHNYSIIHGYAGSFTKETLAKVKSSGDVEKIEEDADTEYYGTDDFDQIFRHDLLYEKDLIYEQKPSPWGLNRISQKDKLSTTDLTSKEFKYRYIENFPLINGQDPTKPKRQKVNIYVIDTGIKTDHDDFDDRASWGWAISESEKKDTYGHGTQVASVAGGNFCGAYKHARLIACKDGNFKQTIKCLDYIEEQWKANGIPSVVNMSGGYYDPGPNQKKTTLDDAVKKAIKAGIHVVAAAGKYRANDNASSTTPARVPGVITVAASNIKDEFHKKSNHGSVVDFFAPGCDITVADKKDTESFTTNSGSSFAAPHVAGLVAYVISISGNVSPAEMVGKLKKNAIANVLTDVPDDTPNLLVNNGFK